MKHEWKKQEKGIYLPKDKPELINVPPFRFYSVTGEGNPNDEFFGEYIGVLYSLSYGIRMSPKQGIAPEDYFEYTVYPLEGVWDINEEAKNSYEGRIDKNTLVFNLMIRQPDFVTADFANEIIDRTKIKKPHELLNKVKFSVFEEGTCIQMLHMGSYDNEPESFMKMELFAREHKLERITPTHREIYISDPRKVAPEKLKTILRFQVNQH